jgi:hypothetical protein
MWQYISAVAKGKSARKIDKRRQDLIQAMNQARQNIFRLPTYQGDATLKDSTVAYLSLCNIVLREDYDKILDLEEIAEQSYDLMEAYLKAKEMADEKLDQAQERLNLVQETYAAKYNINLVEGEESKLSSRINKATDVFKYYNVVYLIFFKSYKQELYLMDALQKQDVNAIEQNRNALSITAKEGLELLDTIKSFKRDISLVGACQGVLRFYQIEADERIDIFRDFHMLEENLNMMKTALESKKPKDRTQEEIDVFNQTINEYNTMVTKVNKTNEELNKFRTKYLDEWTTTSNEFLGRHIN